MVLIAKEPVTSAQLTMHMHANGKHLPQRTNTPSLKDEREVIVQGFPEPPHREGSQNMAVCHEQHVCTGHLSVRWTHRRPMKARAHVVNQSVKPARDLLWGSVGRYTLSTSWSLGRCLLKGLLSPRTTIYPDVKLALLAFLFPLLIDLRRGQSFVVAVVPFANVLGDLDSCGGAGRGLAGPSIRLLPEMLLFVAQIE